MGDTGDRDGTRTACDTEGRTANPTSRCDAVSAASARRNGERSSRGNGGGYGLPFVAAGARGETLPRPKWGRGGGCRLTRRTERGASGRTRTAPTGGARASAAGRGEQACGAGPAVAWPSWAGVVLGRCGAQGGEGSWASGKERPAGQNRGRNKKKTKKPPFF